MDLRFEWDDRKDVANQVKHRVSFQEASTVFSDASARFMDDPDHSAAEDRYLLLGMSSATRILVVSHCFRDKDDVIRIISARRATRTERATYIRRRKK
ncbi:MAG: BrnT family toxin [Planctomycetes bacterium]|nr:BrnT family toxin [Planctomycetota bacterium]